MNLLARLDSAFAVTPDPDQIAARIRTGEWVQGKNMTIAQYMMFKGRQMTIAHQMNGTGTWRLDGNTFLVETFGYDYVVRQLQRHWFIPADMFVGNYPL